MSKHLEVEMNNLKKKLSTMTSILEDMVKKSVRSVENEDKVLAKEVIRMDEIIDQKEVEIEEDCLKILALYQPVAIDLRMIIGIMKMNNDLERIGDLAVNIAERAYGLCQMPSIDKPFCFQSMEKKTYSMFIRAIDSLINMDKKLAKQVCVDDQEVDDINKDMYKLFFERAKKNPENIEPLIQYLSISRHLERIADYSTNIAEDVIYMIEGTIVRHDPELGGFRS